MAIFNFITLVLQAARGFRQLRAPRLRRSFNCDQYFDVAMLTEAPPRALSMARERNRARIRPHLAAKFERHVASTGSDSPTLLQMKLKTATIQSNPPSASLITLIHQQKQRVGGTAHSSFARDLSTGGHDLLRCCKGNVGEQQARHGARRASHRNLPQSCVPRHRPGW